MENSTVNPPPENNQEKAFQQFAAEILNNAPSAIPGGIGGWLLIPAAGLFVMTFLRVGGITKMLPSFASENWQVLTNPASPGYHLAWAPLMVSELAVEVFLLALGLALIILFYRRKKKFRQMIIGYYLLDIISVICGTLGVTVISMKQFELSRLFSPENCRQILNGSLWAIIWIPYFMKSKRVKNTFVND